MASRDVEMAWRSADQLGEGPVWDDRERLLYRVDPVAGVVLSLDPGAGTERRYEIGCPVGCVALRDDGDGLLLGLRDGHALPLRATRRRARPRDRHRRQQRHGVGLRRHDVLLRRHHRAAR